MIGFTSTITFQLQEELVSISPGKVCYRFPSTLDGSLLIQEIIFWTITTLLGYTFHIVACVLMQHFSPGRNYKLVLGTQASFTFSGFMVSKKCHLYPISCFICYHSEHSRSLSCYFSEKGNSISFLNCKEHIWEISSFCL